jgi:hypothetical protein
MPTFITVNGIRYEICDHCLKQMARRGVKKQNIQSCLNHHDVACIFKEGYSVYIEDYPSGKRLQITLNDKNNVVVTVVWLD